VAGVALWTLGNRGLQCRLSDAADDCVVAQISVLFGILCLNS
jgi:hypothetical protein